MPRSRERGSAVVEFVLVAAVALTLALATAQFALFLYERNVVMGALAEGARVGAAYGRGADAGERAAGTLVRQAVGGRVAGAVHVQGRAEGDLVVLHAVGELPSFVPGVPGLPVRMTASMHREERLCTGGCPARPAG
ncbi:MAG TPA: TadE/TadG family type IV pilus assembly protein [Actinomycetes bacterium]